MEPSIREQAHEPNERHITICETEEPLVISVWKRDADYMMTMNNSEIRLSCYSRPNLFRRMLLWILGVKFIPNPKEG